jgi:hypothetical protein
MQEYVVTLKSLEDLEQFYSDMELDRGSTYIPKRSVEVAVRRPFSKNTNYFLTKEEAELLKNDPRVLDVNIPLSKNKNISISPSWSQSENAWNKSAGLVRTHRNWGILRCTLGEQIPGWGSNVTPSQSGTVEVIYEGSNVDIVVVDGHINPNHPEFAYFSDGTGGTRVIQYNWFQNEANITGGAASTYPYPTFAGGYNTTNDNHGCHVAGIIAGNSNGWARKANVYNIKPYGSTVTSEYLFEYIREFHLNKGNDNPTIVNNSWAFQNSVDVTEILSINYRGNTISGPFTSVDTANLVQYGLIDTAGTGRYSFGVRRTDIDADIQECANLGIIFVGSTGNYGFKIDVPGGEDWDNSVTTSADTYYYHRGSSPGCSITDDNIKLTVTVGSVGSLDTEYKANLTGSGPRIDLFAPGTNVMSSVNTPIGFGGISDTRNGSFFITKATGTSQATAQVTGVIACYLESDRTANLNTIFEKLASNLTTSNNLVDTMGGFGDARALLGAPNLYLFADFTVSSTGYTRPALGVVYPPLRYTNRGTSYVVYPRYDIKI